jgi:O-antigen/teichoic acid export membrane protein
MAMLVSGTGIAKVIGMLFVPVITRIYQPEHMGVLSVFTALTAILVPFGSLRYTTAIPLPKNDGAATNIAVLCGLCLLITSILTFLVFWVSAPSLLRLLSMEKLLPFWWLLPFAFASTGLYELLSSWAVREKAFKPLAKTKIWQAITSGSFKIGLGFFGFKPLGLLIGQLFNQAGGVLSLSISFWGKFKLNYRHVSKSRILFVAKHYADFPKYRLPSQFLLVLSTKAPLFFFAWQFGSGSTGQIGLALMILALPITLVGQTTGQAYYAEIAKIGRRQPEKIFKLTQSITKRLFLVSIPPFLILTFFGPWLFQVVFGQMWREAGLFASILAIYLLTQFISAPMINALSVFKKQKELFFLNIVRLLLISFVFSISFAFEIEPAASLLLYSVTLSIYYTLISITVLRIIYVQIKR